MNIISSVGFQFLKLTEHQAMTLTREDMAYGFDHLVKKYGTGKLLPMGERYEGYGLFYNGVDSFLVKMKGSVRRFKNYQGDDFDLRAYSKSGSLYQVFDDDNDGHFKYVWMLSLHRWEKFAEPEVAISLRKKIHEAASNDYLLDVTDEECVALINYLSISYYEKFFIEC